MVDAADAKEEGREAGRVAAEAWVKERRQVQLEWIEGFCEGFEAQTGQRPLGKDIVRVWPWLEAEFFGIWEEEDLDEG